MPAPTLSPSQRSQLDGIVQKMTANGESSDTIQSVVDDFKQKYAGASSPFPASVPQGALSQIFQSVQNAFAPPPNPQQSAGGATWQALMKAGQPQNVPGVPGGISPPPAPPMVPKDLDNSDPITRNLTLPMDGRQYPGNAMVIGALPLVAGAYNLGNGVGEGESLGGLNPKTETAS